MILNGFVKHLNLSVMKRIKYITILWLSLIFFTSLNIHAQMTDPDADYDKAMQLYNYGMADSALNVLKPYLNNKKELSKLSKESCTTIFRLAALSAIMTGNTTEAGAYVRQMVTYKPDYRNKYLENDLTEFRLIVDRSPAQPSVRIGLMGGINIPFVSVLKKYSDYESAGESYNIDRKTGYQLDIFGEITLGRRISMEASAGMTRIMFNYLTTDQVSQYQYNQSITYIEIPVVVRYNFLPDKQCKPYLEFGIFSRFPLFTREESADFGKYWFTESSNSDKILTTFETDIEKFGLVAGTGVTYDFPNISFRLDIRYNHNFKSSSKTSAFDNIDSFDDIPAGEKFHYTDDINLISLKNLQFSVGFLYNLKYKVF
jgi:hypothetical protein